MCARASTLWLSAFGENILTIEEKKNNKQTKKIQENQADKWIEQVNERALKPHSPCLSE